MSAIKGLLKLQMLEEELLGIPLIHMEVFGGAAAAFRDFFRDLKGPKSLESWAMLCSHLYLQVLKCKEPIMQRGQIKDANKIRRLRTRLRQMKSETTTESLGDDNITEWTDFESLR